MRKNSFIALMIGGLMVVGVGTGAQAGAAAQDQVAPNVAEALGKVDAEFTRHTREHRMMEIQRNMGRQQHGRGNSYGRGYGHRGYGGPPPGYGHRGYGNRGYGPRPYSRF
ncbi:hypothetical protein DWF00_27590 [Bosea caraganae]|uniref:Uncharacterized protein n=1 Tax=Bosea caraganae TaxID=2763117 RepID=A0A370KXJ0_9HYPH|nr:hypothetical protein [Bosea caraganae]RDJ19719.1 hypothetical protein DWE98_28140 [Bosea caraganae]RDJ21400.1 hypothetical protein DWF00_27590 [Bosea caraganae]